MEVNLTQKTIDVIADNFTGREDMEGYDATKSMKLYELNRDFVWTEDLQQKLIMSILEGFPIPAITLCNGKIIDGGNRITTLWLFKNNKFEVNINGEDYNYTRLCDNRDLIRKWDRCQLPIVDITNATNEQIAQIYENLNKGVKLTTGQLLENRKFKPIVNSALSIIGRSSNNEQFPYRELVNRVWINRIRKTKSRTEISFAFQLLVGSMYGPQFFTNSFEKIVHFITAEDQHVDFTNLHFILTMIDEVDPGNVISRAKKSECFRKLVGAIIHDMFTMPRSDVKTKWQKMFHMAYNVITTAQFKALFDIGSARGNNDLRVEKISSNVTKYLNGELQARDPEEETTYDSEETDD